MGKLIAFYGSPNSGKTSIAFKIAMETYMRTKDVSIYFLSPDLNVPSAAFLFPNYCPDEIVSLSEAFDKTEISEDVLLKNSVTIKTMKDFAVGGFKAGDNKYCFPTPTDDKISSLYATLLDSFGYVFVDCTLYNDDIISKRALKSADVVFRVITPDLKGTTWYSSHKNSEREEGKDLFNIVNITENELYLPTEEVCSSLHSVISLIPYSKALKRQMLEGVLYDKTKDKAFNKKIQTIVSKIL